MKNYVVRTLGCKANLYDSQLIEAELQKRGWKPARSEEEPLSLCLVNSCTVTDEADKQTRRLASKLYREHPGARIVVTGCGAEVDPERLAASKGIHYIIGNRDKPRLVELILEKLEAERASGQELFGQFLGGVQSPGELLSRHPMDREWPLPETAFQAPPVHLDGNSGTTRAFLKIQEGCNSFCTYCVIPYGRGPSRSLEPSKVVEQVRELVRQGIREVIITGTNVGDYTTPVAELFSRILGETGLERLRVSSLDPLQITPELFSLMEREPRFCPHFHVSLQSTHARILKQMKRGYGPAEVRACLERIATLSAPVGGAFVGMDLITGFPGETVDDFEEGLETLRVLPWTRLHVFPYSERNGTPALRIAGSVGQEERVRRARTLQKLSLERFQARGERVLRECVESKEELQGILLEKPTRVKGQLRRTGYTPNYWRVLLEEDSVGARQAGRNEIIRAIPTGVEVDPAQGEVFIVART